LIGYVFRPVCLIFHAVGQIFGPVGLSLHFGSEVLGPSGLIAGSHGKIMSVFTPTMHFPPLTANEEGSQSRHNHGSPGPPQSSSLKGVHFALYFSEVIIGIWGSWWGVERLDSLTLRRTLAGFTAILTGWFLMIHGGLRLQDRKRIEAAAKASELTISDWFGKPWRRT